MNPTSSGINKTPCSPVASTCVLWTGPDLPCIDLCKGDSVSDVVYKMASLLCTLKEDLDLSDLDLKNIFQACAQCPEPAKTLKVVLQALIDKVADIEQAIKTPVGGTAEEVIIRIATCFRENLVDGNGDPIIDLKHSEYTKMLGTELCEVIFTVGTIGMDITGLKTEVSSLNQRVGTLELADDGLEELENRIFTLEQGAAALAQTLGTPADVSQILSEEVTGNGPGGAVMSLAGSSVALYAGNSQHAAESMTRMWKIVADLRSAVKIIQDNCCKISCEDIVIDFDIKLSDDRTQATLFFANKSMLPAGFTDANILGSKLVITDANGASMEVNIKIAEEVQNVEGFPIDLNASALNPNVDYFFNMDASVKSESMTCVKCISKTATYKDTCAYCEFTAVGDGSAEGTAIIIYEEI